MTNFSKCSFLLVSDSAPLRRLTRAALRNFGAHDIDEAANPAKALRIEITDRSYHLIIASLDMKPMDGAEFVRLLRGARTLKGRDTPVLGLVGDRREDLIKAAIEAGVDDLVALPFSQQGLAGKHSSRGDLVVRGLES